LKSENFKDDDILPPPSRTFRSRASSKDEDDEAFLDGLIFMAPPNSEDYVRSMMGQMSRRYSCLYKTFDEDDLAGGS
jgi:hypothetical protein